MGALRKTAPGFWANGLSRLNPSQPVHWLCVHRHHPTKDLCWKNRLFIILYQWCKYFSFAWKMHFWWKYWTVMVTSPNGNIFRVTGPLSREFIGHRWISLTKSSEAELWCFLWCAPWINSCVNNCEAGDLSRHRAHYDIIVVLLDWVVELSNI